MEFTNDWEADALRRDLTINAMTMDMQGNVFDYFQGKQHLAEHMYYCGSGEDVMLMLCVPV